MIELADKWTRQPQRPTGVSAEWRQRGLVALFDTRAGIELIHNNRASNLSTTLSPSAGGMAADFSGTANQQYAHRDAYSTTGAMTLVFVMDVDTLSNYGALIAKQGTTTSNGPYEVRLGAGSGDSQISMLRASSANYGTSNASGSNLISAGEKIVRLVIRFTEADEIPIGHAFVNGAKLSFGGLPVGRPPTDNTLATVWIGRRYDGATQMDGRIYYVALFNRAISDTEAQALTQNPWQLYAKRPKRLFAAPAVTKAVGLAAETDTAFALSAALAGATGLAAETDTALTLSGLQARAVGLATEVDAALPLAAAQSQLVGLATETDTAFALSAGASTPVGLAAETDTAFALNAVQLKAVGLSTESDTAFALSAVQITTTGLASEADTAFALSAGASTPVGLATETDTAFALGAVQLKAVGLSTETDSALTLSAARPAGLATETDTALTLTGLQIRGVGLASEASTALALAGLQLRATGLATETDIALARAPVQIRSAGLSTEVDTALALAPNVPGAVGLAVETDIALALAGRQIRAVGMATETDAALALTPIQRMAPGLALEIDASFALSAVQLRAVGLATETDTALALDPASTGGTADPADVWNYVLSNGLTAEETAVQTHAMLTALLASCPADLALVLKLLRNKQVTNPSTGRMTVYDDDGSTVLLEGNLFEDAAGVQPYRGQGAERRERLT